MLEEYQEYQEYQDDQIYLENYHDQYCNCFALFSKRKRNFEEGISTSAYTPYVPRIDGNPWVSDYSNPYADAYILHSKKRYGILKFCPFLDYFNNF